jgi:hypothetical protein
LQIPDTAQQVPVSTTIALRTTKKLQLLPFKIRQLQAIEEGDRRETHFYNRFLWVVCDSVLDPKLTFYPDKAWFHPSGYIDSQNIRYRRNINFRQF